MFAENTHFFPSQNTSPGITFLRGSAAVQSSGDETISYPFGGSGAFILAFLAPEVEGMPGEFDDGFHRLPGFGALPFGQGKSQLLTMRGQSTWSSRNWVCARTRAKHLRMSGTVKTSGP